MIKSDFNSSNTVNVLILGNSECGKTSFIKKYIKIIICRLVYDSFEEKYIETLGIDVYVKEMSSLSKYISK